MLGNTAEGRPIDEEFKQTLALLNARANLINGALFWAIGAALATVSLIIVSFFYAFYNLPHEFGVAILFVLAMLMFGAALINFAREVRIVMNDPNNFD